MKDKNHLILDVAGVLLTNLTPLFWEEISKTSGSPYDVIRNEFKRNIRDDLWNGKIDEREFWEWLNHLLNKDAGTYNRDLIRKYLKPLPAFDHLESWNKYFHIHLLSNHRTEWIMPVFNEQMEFIETVTISSDVGYCKPDKEIYRIVAQKIDHNENTKMIFVDDQEKNLLPAREMGWTTIRTDHEGKWMDRIQDEILSINI